MYKYKNDLLILIFSCTKNYFWVKESFRDWNSQLKSESVDLDVQEANDRDSNSNVKLITIATVKIENNNKQIQ